MTGKHGGPAFHILCEEAIGLFFYTIKPGDTIYQIAAQFGIPVNALLAANPGLSPYRLVVGQQILIPAAQRPQTGMVSQSEMALRNNLRMIWVDYVYWIRMAINAIASNSGDLATDTARLSRNAADLAAALAPYFGEAVAARAQALFQNFLNLTLQWIRAMTQGNAPAVQNAQRQVYAAADQIAAYFSSLSGYWPADRTRAALYTLLNLIGQETAARLSHNYDQSAAVYDQMKSQAMAVADLTADGIVRQFPARFGA